VRAVIDAPAAAVWDELSDIASHVHWMADAETITFTGERRRGVGTTLDVVTRVGPLRTVDKMIVTSWHDGREIGVRHEGVVTGEGAFTLDPASPGRTVVTWSEHLRFPWYLGGPVTALLAAPVLRHIWHRNLGRLATRTVTETRD
jgi:carbon monoxide dehydrogenase subunit G